MARGPPPAGGCSRACRRPRGCEPAVRSQASLGDVLDDLVVELLDVDGFSDETVEARLVEALTVVRHDRRGQRDDWDARRVAIGADPPQRLEAVDARNLDIHKDEVR